MYLDLKYKLGHHLHKGLSCDVPYQFASLV